MQRAFLPIVANEIWSRHPDYRALSVSAGGFRVSIPEVMRTTTPITTPTPATWLESHIEAWRAAYRAFGANPKKTSCSAEALFKRLQKSGELPVISPVVDLYNNLSIRFGAPFGGEDCVRYVGMPRLVFAEGDEEFDTSREGSAVMEHPEPGEVIWRDEQGVTCRRWNWRQCKRTALTDVSEDLWFVIDRLSPMPMDELHRAGEELVLGLRRLCPDVQTVVSVIEPA